MGSNNSITAIILTFNEEANIERCLLSVADIAERLIVVDSFSTDHTADIAKRYGAEVYQHEFINQAKQFNWALDNLDIKTIWVIRLDADEEITPSLQREIKEACSQDEDSNINGLIIGYDTIFMGRRLQYGGVNGFQKMIVFKTKYGRMENRAMDEHTILSKGKPIPLKNKALHHFYRNMSYNTLKYNNYATRMVDDFFMIEDIQTADRLPNKMLRRTRKLKGFYFKLPLFIRPFMLFIWRYFLELGFLDGKEGFVYHFTHNLWYRELIDAKIFEHLKYGGEFEEAGALKV